MATSHKSNPVVHNLPEDDDDLDDLDDVLAQFTPASRENQPQSPGEALVSPPPPPPTATTTTTFSRPRTNTRVDAPPISVPGSGRGLETAHELDEDGLSETFSRELQKCMESLMRELGSASLSESAEGENRPEGELGKDETERMFKAAWEAMLVEGMDGTVQSTSNDTKEPSSAPMTGTEPDGGGPSNTFQDQIRQAMDKLRESESNLQAGNSNPDPLADATPESLEALLATFNDLGLGESEGPEDEAELTGLLDNMMNQLMTKDVLYEPLKELEEAYPQYLANPTAPITDDDRQKYDLQLACVRKILAVFSGADYSDSNPTMKASITDLMNELQTYGSPPAEVMGPIPLGMNLGADGMSQMGEGCVIA